MPLLTLKFKDTIVKKYKLENNKTVSIGRRKTNDIVIENLVVSGSHAKIEASKDGFVLSDSQSKNGTFVNNKSVNTRLLKNGDVIRIGMHTLIFSEKD
ncbi:MAG: FHA domain-containing protein [Thermodesulfobacteriota bacterium]|nr:FHA domain-containing protein [Thermodesulfobacteriota bacterium]